MPIPAEVQAAQSLLKQPLRFGDEAQIRAVEVLNRYEKRDCAFCDGNGRTKPDYLECRACDCTGKVWVRR